jgi:hypothetical protein
MPTDAISLKAFSSLEGLDRSECAIAEIPISTARAAADRELTDKQGLH